MFTIEESVKGCRNILYNSCKAVIWRELIKVTLCKEQEIIIITYKDIIRKAYKILGITSSHLMVCDLGRRDFTGGARRGVSIGPGDTKYMWQSFVFDVILFHGMRGGQRALPLSLHPNPSSVVHKRAEGS